MSAPTMLIEGAFTYSEQQRVDEWLVQEAEAIRACIDVESGVPEEWVQDRERLLKELGVDEPQDVADAASYAASLAIGVHGLCEGRWVQAGTCNAAALLRPLPGSKVGVDVLVSYKRRGAEPGTRIRTSIPEGSTLVGYEWTIASNGLRVAKSQLSSVSACEVDVQLLTAKLSAATDKGLPEYNLDARQLALRRSNNAEVFAGVRTMVGRPADQEYQTDVTHDSGRLQSWE